MTESERSVENAPHVRLDAIPPIAALFAGVATMGAIRFGRVGPAWFWSNDGCPELAETCTQIPGLAMALSLGVAVAVFAVFEVVLHE